MIKASGDAGGQGLDWDVTHGRHRGDLGVPAGTRHRSCLSARQLGGPGFRNSAYRRHRGDLSSGATVGSGHRSCQSVLGRQFTGTTLRQELWQCLDGFITRGRHWRYLGLIRGGWSYECVFGGQRAVATLREPGGQRLNRNEAWSGSWPHFRNRATAAGGLGPVERWRPRVNLWPLEAGHLPRVWTSSPCRTYP